LPYDSTGINNDILVTPEQGQWMILLISYAGKEGPLRARKMVCQLRTIYKLPAYVFNYGAEEKRKELQRVTALIEKQKEDLKKSDLTVDQPIRVRHIKIDEHCGVLIGGYPNMEAAAKARNQLRTLKPNARDFTLETEGDLLDLKFVMDEQNVPGKAGNTQVAFVDPFQHGFVVHNPTIKVERPADATKLDVAALKRMNSEEDFSLLKCKKAYTLAIKQFSLPSVTAPRNDSASSSFWDVIGFGKKSNDSIDYAAENAHRFADMLRQSKLEAYVLHMKYCSLVTIGGFDSVDDPNLRSMQNLIDTRLLPQMGENMQMFPKAMPMPIPH
jgi:hypothetical protein